MTGAMVKKTAFGYALLYLYKWSYLNTLFIPKDFLEYDIIEITPIIVVLLPIVYTVMLIWSWSKDSFSRLILKNPGALYSNALALSLLFISVLHFWATGDSRATIIGLAGAILLGGGNFIFRPGKASQTLRRFIRNKYAWLILFLFTSCALSSIIGVGAARNRGGFVEFLDLPKEHPASLLIGIYKCHDKFMCIEIDSTLTYV
jgi:hypothetical protein